MHPAELEERTQEDKQGPAEAEHPCEEPKDAIEDDSRLLIVGDIRSTTLFIEFFSTEYAMRSKGSSAQLFSDELAEEMLDWHSSAGAHTPSAQRR